MEAVMDVTAWFYPVDWTMGGVIGFVFASVMRMFMLFKFGYQWANWAKQQNKFVQAINKPPLYLVFGFGFVYDIFLNWTVAVLIWQEWPKTRFETITWRLDRYVSMSIHGANPGWLQWWRFRSAVFICEKLNKIDVGHCGSLHNPAAALATLRGA